MKPWIGRWLVAVAALHTLLAVAVFSEQFSALAARGLVNAVGADLKANLAVWFTLFGVVLLICGLAISALERAAAAVIPKVIGVSLLVLAGIGVVIMPASGFWLVIPAAVAILLRRPQAASNA